MLPHGDDVFILGQIGSIDDHTASRDRKREERLSHRPDPDHRVFKRLPARGEHEFVALGGAGQERHADGKHEEDQEECRHHDLVGLFDAVRAEIECQKCTHHNDYMIRNNGEIARRERAEPACRIRAHERAGDRVNQRLQKVRDDDRVADCDAQRACQRQPAEKSAGFSHLFAARCPGVFIRAQRAGCGASAHGEFCRERDVAENEDEQQIDEQKCAAAVAAELVGEAPDVRHADGRADRRKNKAPTAGKMLGVFGVFHLFSALPVGRFPFSLSSAKSGPARSPTASTHYIVYIVKRLSMKVKENLFLYRMSEKTALDLHNIWRQHSIV